MPEPAIHGAIFFSVVIDEPPAQLGAHQLLRAFDRAGRDLAQRLVGTAGAGAGYDAVHVDWPALSAVPGGSTLTVTAMLIERRRRRHLVEFVATATPPAACDADIVRTVELARAHGWTLTGALPPGDLVHSAAGVDTEVEA